MKAVWPKNGIFAFHDKYNKLIFLSSSKISTSQTKTSMSHTWSPDRSNKARVSLKYRFARFRLNFIRKVTWTWCALDSSQSSHQRTMLAWIRRRLFRSRRTDHQQADAVISRGDIEDLEGAVSGRGRKNRTRDSQCCLFFACRRGIEDSGEFLVTVSP